MIEPHAFRGMNAISVDVEDYFHVSALEKVIGQRQWASCEHRVEANTDKLLDLFADADVRATFFFLGWVAERFPQLLRRVVQAGHEIGSHGYNHVQVRDQDRGAFREDVLRTKALLEDIAGVLVNGYRAASFSIGRRTPWAYEVLVEAGHTYSSSINPITHDRYHARDMPRFPYVDAASQLPELPVSTGAWHGLRWPCGGGGYFRLLPYRWTRWNLTRVNTVDEQPVNFYLHPWEIDPDQPRVAGLGPATRFRHYVNLSRTEGKLKRLLRDFRWTTIQEAYEPLIHPGAATRQPGVSSRTQTAGAIAPLH